MAVRTVRRYLVVMPSHTPSIGELLRQWRQRRRLSQLALATDAGISQRHLSFLESGRSLPSRGMLLHLTQRLALPLRERNRLLLAAGLSPHYGERPLDAPDLTPVRQVIERLLEGHVPYPALAVDRYWTLLAANRALGPLLDVIDSALLEPPLNVLRLSLHPDGLAPRIRNFHEWRDHVLERLARQFDGSGDPRLLDLAEELREYPAPSGARPSKALPSHSGILVPLELELANGETLSLLSTTTVFGTPLDVTLEELAIESFFPADAATAEALRRLTAPPEVET